MSAISKPKLTAAEYLAIEKKAEFKSEFFLGEMFAMAGANPIHKELKDAMVAALRNRFKGGPCKTASSDQRVLVDRTGLYTYPDIVIFCEKPEYDDADPPSLLNPTVIIEVLSPSTEKYDRGAKFRNYKLIPSLKEYVLVAQDEALIDQYVRQTNGAWALESFVGLEDKIAFATVPANIPLADIYYGVDFPPQPEPPNKK